MPPSCLCGHKYGEHRDGGACTRCSRCLIFEAKDDPVAKRDMAQVLRDFPSAEQMAWRKQEQQWSLEVTIGAVTPENIHPEIDIGPPVGLEAEVLAGLEGMRREADRPLLGGVPYRLTEQAPLWEPEPPEFPMEMPHDDRDASEIPHTPEPDPWWLDA